MIRPELARRAGMEVTRGAPMLVGSVVGGRRVSMPLVRARSLSVGAATVEDLDIGVFDALPGRPEVDGKIYNSCWSPSPLRSSVAEVRRARLSFIMRQVVGRNPEMVFCSMLGALASFVIGIVDPRVLNKAGPDWLWMGGRDDAIRNLYFKPNGSFKRYGRAALFVTLVAGTAAFAWMLHPLM